MSFMDQHMESFRMAVAAVKSNKARGILTTLGIIIGIVARGHDHDGVQRAGQ